MHMLRQYDPGIDPKWSSRFDRSDCTPKRVNVGCQKLASTVLQIHRKKPGSSVDVISSIVGHVSPFSQPYGEKRESTRQADQFRKAARKLHDG
jgi:hypothetical protein